METTRLRDTVEQGENAGARAMPLIRLEGVTRVFTTEEVETHALEGVNLEIHRGEYLSIAGPSGCGKSTLLSLLGLLDSPTKGRYWLKGKAVEMLGFEERARIRNQIGRAHV